MNNNEATNLANGIYGNTVIIDSSTHTGKWGSIFVLEDVVITTLTIANSDGSFSGLTITAFTWIYGEISEIQIASGKLIAYKGKP